MRCELNQGRQSGLKTRGVVGLGLKTGGVLKFIIWRNIAHD